MEEQLGKICQAMSACPESKQLLQEINGEQKQKKGEVCSGKYTEQI